MPNFKNSAAIAAAVLTMFGTSACMTTGSSGKGMANKAAGAKQSVSEQDEKNEDGWFNGMKGFFVLNDLSKFHASNMIDASMEQGFTSVTRNGNDIVGKGFVKDPKTNKGICEYSMCFDPKSGKGTFEVLLMDKNAGAVEALSKSIGMPNDKIQSIAFSYHTNPALFHGLIDKRCTIVRAKATDVQREDIKMSVSDLAHGKIYSSVYGKGVENALTDKTKDLINLAPPVTEVKATGARNVRTATNKHSVKKKPTRGQKNIKHRTKGRTCDR